MRSNISRQKAFHIGEVALDNMAARNLDLEELVGNIISHPSFQATLNTVFRASPSSAEAAVRPATSMLENNQQQFNNAQEEFSSIFRQGNSLGSCQSFPRGRNNRRSSGFVAVSTRPSSVPSTPYNRRSTQVGRCSRSQNDSARNKFRVKEVVLLADSKTDQVVRANQKALLMDKGHVLNDIEMDKSWTEEEVLSCLEKCFHGMLQCISLPETNQSSRYELMCFVCNCSL